MGYSVITQGSAAHPVTLSDVVWGLHLKEVHWPQGGPIVIVDMEGQFVNPTTGRTNIHFKSVPADKDTITINGTLITFGLGQNVEIGVDAEHTVSNLVEYLNTEPHPVTKVTATADGANVRLDWETAKLTLAKSSAAITLVGSSFFEDPSLEEETVITKEMYGGLALYSPYAFNHAFQSIHDLLYLVYVQIIGSDPPTFKINNVYSSRFHRALLVNMDLTEPIIELDIVSPAQDNYIFISPSAYPVRLMQPISNDFVITAYAVGTEFKTEAGGKITTTAKPLWTFSKSIVVQDPRKAPGNSAGAVSAFNAIGDSPQLPYGTIKFDKNGEVI